MRAARAARSPGRDRAPAPPQAPVGLKPTWIEAAVRHWREAYGLARALVGDPGRAEELTQEAYVRMAGMDTELDDREDGARRVLLRIVRNLAVSELRRPRLALLEDERGADARAALEGEVRTGVVGR